MAACAPGPADSAPHARSRRAGLLRGGAAVDRVGLAWRLKPRARPRYIPYTRASATCVDSCALRDTKSAAAVYIHERPALPVRAPGRSSHTVIPKRLAPLARYAGAPRCSARRHRTCPTALGLTRGGHLQLALALRDHARLRTCGHHSIRAQLQAAGLARAATSRVDHHPLRLDTRGINAALDLTSHLRPIVGAHTWSPLREDFRTNRHPNLDASPRASHCAPAHAALVIRLSARRTSPVLSSAPRTMQSSPQRSRRAMRADNSATSSTDNCARALTSYRSPTAADRPAAAVQASALVQCPLPRRALLLSAPARGLNVNPTLDSTSHLHPINGTLTPRSQRALANTSTQWRAPTSVGGETASHGRDTDWKPARLRRYG
ncbi:hypothetical protein B0H14DRAFT_3481610 [Mycena olivaceomarginata]|nr:hypothetical protein B0H14DRAFT_3481610 [Mycena olivaceomarginata]